MSIKWIVMDMDGTLLRYDNTITAYTQEVLVKAQKQGMRLILASGRSYRKLMPYAKQLQMERYGGLLIEVNGIARYALAEKKREVFHQLDTAQVKDIFVSLQDLDVEVLFLKDDAIYDYIPASVMEAKKRYRIQHHIPEDTPWTGGAFSFVFDNREGYPFQYAVHTEEDLPTQINKAAICQEAEKLKQYLPEIYVRLQDRYWLGLTSPGWLEIMPKGVTKGNALKELEQQGYLSLKEVLAFGDGENDVEMLQEAGIGVAMGNALESVKQKADAVCESNENDGLAHYIETYILSK